MIPSPHTASQNGIIIALASGDVLLLDCFQDPEYPAFLSKASLLVKENTHPFMHWHRGKFGLIPVLERIEGTLNPEKDNYRLW